MRHCKRGTADTADTIFTGIYDLSSMAAARAATRFTKSKKIRILIFKMYFQLCNTNTAQKNVRFKFFLVGESDCKEKVWIFIKGGERIKFQDTEGQRLNVQRRQLHLLTTTRA